VRDVGLQRGATRDRTASATVAFPQVPSNGRSSSNGRMGVVCMALCQSHARVAGPHTTPPPLPPPSNAPGISLSSHSPRCKCQVRRDTAQWSVSLTLALSLPGWRRANTRPFGGVHPERSRRAQDPLKRPGWRAFSVVRRANPCGSPLTSRMSGQARYSSVIRLAYPDMCDTDGEPRGFALRTIGFRTPSRPPSEGGADDPLPRRDA